eukprot:scaffold110443_cov66-Phaeocystis_antarctica.AAC.3
MRARTPDSQTGSQAGHLATHACAPRLGQAVHIDAATDVPAHAISHRISPTASPTTYVPLVLPTAYYQLTAYCSRLTRYVPLFWVTDYDETPEELRPTRTLPTLLTLSLSS